MENIVTLMKFRLHCHRLTLLIVIHEYRSSGFAAHVRYGSRLFFRKHNYSPNSWLLQSVRVAVGQTATVGRDGGHRATDAAADVAGP